MKRSLYHVKEPFIFNPLKHHWGYVKEWVREASEEKDSLHDLLKKLGNSQMDMYMGSLSTKQILKQVRKKIKKKKVFTYASFSEWIDGDHKIVQIKDGSSWVLRIHKEKDRYIHIHPARYSKHSERVQANILKSAIGGFMFRDYYDEPLEAVNHARKLFIGLPPLKTLQDETGVGHWLNHLLETPQLIR
jgi:hypothetical protein